MEIWWLYDRASHTQQYKQPTRCNNNGLLIIPISSTCSGRQLRPSSGALEFIYSLWYNAPTTLLTGSLDEVEPHPGYRSAAWSVHCTTSCRHSLVLLRMGVVVARNMLSWLELLIGRCCCIWLVVCTVKLRNFSSSPYFLSPGPSQIQ